MNNEPVFAIVGHPNEGKSSVLSTLTEDDSVAVSAYPGETVECQRFPIKVQGKKILEFVDTPGFQNPRSVLKWMKESGLTDDALLDAFVSKFENNQDFHHDCELMRPLKEGAGVIYVVDCSRPLLEEDQAEMEILRLINKPRMAVINYKEKDLEYLDDWKTAFRRHFNVIREFNAHQAGFDERIALLETLKAIHQDWEHALAQAIDAFQRDWLYRKARAAEEIVRYLDEVLNFKVEKSYGNESESERVKEKAVAQYQKKLLASEQKLFQEIRRLYRHQVYDFKLPPQSILNEDLFSDRTWQLLGLTQKQLLIAATGMGAGIGAALDVAASGLSFGIFTAAGALTAGGGTLFKGKELTRIRIKRMPLGGSKVAIGPNRNPQFPFILLDRSIMFFNEVASHAHAKRNKETIRKESGIMVALDSNIRTQLTRHFSKLIRSGGSHKDDARSELITLLRDRLLKA